MYKKIINEFTEENPTFIGVKLIFQVTRFLIAEKHEEILSDLNEMIVSETSFLFIFFVLSNK